MARLDEPASDVVDCGKWPVEEMEDLISLHYCMVARVMGGAEGECVGRHVKMFLRLLHTVDQRMSGSSRPQCKWKPVLASRPNFLTLLNLEEAIKHYGPMRLLWEGGRMGK